jgi:hypothetical protein
VSRWRCIDGVHDPGRWEPVSLEKPIVTPAKRPRQRRTRRRRVLSPEALRRPTLSFLHAMTRTASPMPWPLRPGRGVAVPL